MKPTPELLYEYRRSREAAMESANRRMQEARQRIPELADVAKRRRELIFASGTARINGDGEEAQRLLNAAEQLRYEEERLLLSHGIEPESLKPAFRCSLCEDTGYTGDTVRSLCNCMKQRLRELKYDTSSINDNETFRNFRQDIHPLEQQRLNAVQTMEQCRAYAERFPNQSPQDLLMIGNTGLGKSYLINAIAHEVAAKGYEVYKTSAYNLINAALERIRNREAPLDLIGPDLILVDDLGTEPMMESITHSTLFTLINERQSAGKATVWATNRKYEEILRTYGDRFYSRLLSLRYTKVLMLNGKDLRTRIK